MSVPSRKSDPGSPEAARVSLRRRSERRPAAEATVPPPPPPKLWSDADEAALQRRPDMAEFYESIKGINPHLPHYQVYYKLKRPKGKLLHAAILPLGRCVGIGDGGRS